MLRRLLRTFPFILAILVALALALPAVAQDTVQNQLAPASQTLPLPLTGITQLAAGSDFTCGLTTGGGVLCWGRNTFGQLGNDDAPNGSSLPVPVTGLTSGITAIEAGSNHACAITTGGLKCWGDNFYGQLGNNDQPNSSSVPVNVVGLTSGVLAVAAGTAHTCALITGGSVKCWGHNEYSQLGDDNSPTGSDSPVNVVGMGTQVTTIAANATHTCAVTLAGGVKCWGRNQSGQLGDSDAPIDKDTPVDVDSLDGEIAALSVGIDHTCALQTDGGVECWGDNTQGELGNDDAPLGRDFAINVLGISQGAAALALGSSFTCALTATGGVKCWGINTVGQLGDGNLPNNRDVAGDVVGLLSGVTAIAAGDAHACALLAGGVKCWGLNFQGQLGDGANLSRSMPVDVLTPTICYRLTRNKTGSGSVPAADPANTPGCPANHYLPGQIVTLLADSTAGFRVNGWAGTANNGALSEVNYLTMPAADRGVSVTYAKCHTLTRTHTGSGADPVAAPDRSVNCPDNTYVAGEVIALVADAGASARVQGWSGTANNASRADANSLTMPAADQAVSVAYATCRTLTRSHTGAGDDPVASPDRSDNCPENTYISGETVTLIAKPDPDQRVSSWTGADTNPFTGETVNSLTMPNADHAVRAAYETCFVLSAVVAGQGEPITASPANSTGCAASAYVAGQAILLAASPAVGWAISGWDGTANNGSTGNTNQLTMPAAAHAVGVTYVETTVPVDPPHLFLPSLQR